MILEQCIEFGTTTEPYKYQDGLTLSSYTALKSRPANIKIIYLT